MENGYLTEMWNVKSHYILLYGVVSVHLFAYMYYKYIIEGVIYRLRTLQLGCKSIYYNDVGCRYKYLCLYIVEVWTNHQLQYILKPTVHYCCFSIYAYVYAL